MEKRVATPRQMMRSSPERIAEALSAFRAAFGPDEFRPSDILERQELLPLIPKLLGTRRGNHRLRLGRWLRRHAGEQAGELTLIIDTKANARAAIYWIEDARDHDDVSEADVDAFDEELSESIASEIATETNPLRQLRKMERIRIRFEKSQAKVEQRLEWLEIRRSEAEERHVKRIADRAAQRAAEQWAVALKIPTRFLTNAYEFLRHAENTGTSIAVRGAEVPNGTPGLLYVLCSKDRAGEIAGKLQPLIVRFRGQAVPALIGEPEANRRRRDISTRTAKRRERRNRRPIPLDEGCASERAALLAAQGFDPRPGAPGIPGSVAWQLLPRRGWNI